jgi:hypothetical protein
MKARALIRRSPAGKAIDVSDEQLWKASLYIDESLESDSNVIVKRDTYVLK